MFKLCPILAVLFLALLLAGCTSSGYGSDTQDEWWPNGNRKLTRSRRNVSMTHVSREAPAAVGDLLDSGASFIEKHATAIFGTALPTMLLGGGISAAQRRAGKRERERMRDKHEKDRSDEYNAGFMAGVASRKEHA